MKRSRRRLFENMDVIRSRLLKGAKIKFYSPEGMAIGGVFMVDKMFDRFVDDSLEKFVDLLEEVGGFNLPRRQVLDMYVKFVEQMIFLYENVIVGLDGDLKDGFKHVVFDNARALAKFVFGMYADKVFEVLGGVSQVQSGSDVENVIMELNSRIMDEAENFDIRQYGAVGCLYITEKRLKDWFVWVMGEVFFRVLDEECESSGIVLDFYDDVLELCELYLQGVFDNLFSSKGFEGLLIVDSPGQGSYRWFGGSDKCARYLKIKYEKVLLELVKKYYSDFVTY